MKNAIPCNYPVTYLGHTVPSQCAVFRLFPPSLFFPCLRKGRSPFTYVRRTEWMTLLWYYLCRPGGKNGVGIRLFRLPLRWNWILFPHITKLLKSRSKRACQRASWKKLQSWHFCIIMQTVALFDLANLEYFAKSKQWNCGIKKRLREKDGKEKLRMMKREKDISSPESWRKSSCFADSVHKIEEPKWKNGFVYKRLKKSKKGRDRMWEGHKKTDKATLLPSSFLFVAQHFT